MDFKPELEYKHEEVDMLTYKELARIEKDPSTSQLLEKLAAVEVIHAAFWKKIAEKNDVEVKEIGLKEKIAVKWYGAFRKIFGLSLSVKLLELHEMQAIQQYSKILATPNILDDDEKTLLNKVINDEKEHEQLLINEELKVNPDRVRDIIYGISDALVEVLAAVSGFAGVLIKPLLIGVGGLIVGASGTLSMGAGAYVSTKSENEARNAGTDKELNNEHPQSPVSSALTTSGSYLVGVFPPVLPYVLGAGGNYGLLLSYLASAISLFAVGFMVGIASGVRPSHKGAEMTSIGIMAAIATHLLGLAASAYLHIAI